MYLSGLSKVISVVLIDVLFTSCSWSYFIYLIKKGSNIVETATQPPDVSLNHIIYHFPLGSYSISWIKNSQWGCWNLFVRMTSSVSCAVSLWVFLFVLMTLTMPLHLIGCSFLFYSVPTPLSTLWESFLQLLVFKSCFHFIDGFSLGWLSLLSSSWSVF